MCDPSGSHSPSSNIACCGSNGAVATAPWRSIRRTGFADRTVRPLFRRTARSRVRETTRGLAEETPASPSLGPMAANRRSPRLLPSPASSTQSSEGVSVASRECRSYWRRGEMRSEPYEGVDRHHARSGSWFAAGEHGAALVVASPASVVVVECRAGRHGGGTHSGRARSQRRKLGERVPGTGRA
jgi:hypothetical protein